MAALLNSIETRSASPQSRTPLSDRDATKRCRCNAFGALRRRMSRVINLRTYSRPGGFRMAIQSSAAGSTSGPLRRRTSRAAFKQSKSLPRRGWYGLCNHGLRLPILVQQRRFNFWTGLQPQRAFILDPFNRKTPSYSKRISKRSILDASRLEDLRSRCAATSKRLLRWSAPPQSKIRIQAY